MAQELSQHLTQEQKLLQQQRITQQHLLSVKLLSMPLTELEQNVTAELYDNPALEEAYDDDHMESLDDIGSAIDGAASDGEEQSTEEISEQEERQDELNKALENMGSDDDMPEEGTYSYRDSADYEEMVYGEAESFYDRLNEQMGVLDLDDTQSKIMKYLIGSLDSDGLLRKDLSTIADELAIYEYTDCTIDDIERVLRKLQTFDPAGIGARSLQECLRLQVERMDSSDIKTRMLDVIDNHFESFSNKRWDRLKCELNATDDDLADVIAELRKLNPKPGASLGETMGSSMQLITPDFIVYSSDDGRVFFDINKGSIPHLVVSSSYEDMLNGYRDTDDRQLSKGDRDTMVYLRNKVDRAKWYIDGINKRYQTMLVTMTEIIKWQKKFFLDGNEEDLRPMILKDIADRTGLDISTVSRVSNEKYAQTKWGTFPLRYFFNDGYTNEDGEELSTRKIKLALKEIIDKEDKKNPLSDEALVKVMTEQGFPIARRTVAKYRDQMGIPKSQVRRN